MPPSEDFFWFLGPIALVALVLLLSRLREPLLRPFRPRAELAFDAPATLQPGTSLAIRVRMRPQKDMEVHQVRVDLVGRETYYERQTSSSGRGSTTSIVKRVEALEQVPHIFAQQARLPGGVQQRWEASLAVPAGAAPSCKGRVVDVYWKLQAVVTVPYRPDLVREVSLTMLAPIPTQVEAGRDDVPAEGKKTYDECSLSLALRRTGVAAGEIVQGHLQVVVFRALQVRGIRIELVRSEKAGVESSEIVVARQDLSGPLSLQAPDSRSFSYALPLPPEAPPTTESPHSSLRWQVRAVLDRPLRTDFAVQREVHVYTTKALP